jgi:hypothetical protein
LFGAGELVSHFWRRHLRLRRGLFHRYHCSFCNSHWEWVELRARRPKPLLNTQTPPASQPD